MNRSRFLVMHRQYRYFSPHLLTLRKCLPFSSIILFPSVLYPCRYRGDCQTFQLIWNSQFGKDVPVFLDRFTAFPWTFWELWKLPCACTLTLICFNVLDLPGNTQIWMAGCIIEPLPSNYHDDSWFYWQYLFIWFNIYYNAVQCFAERPRYLLCAQPGLVISDYL